MNMSFPQFESFEQVLGTKTRYRLTKPLYWYIGRYGSDWLLIIDEGTEFDISVPSFLTWLLSPHDRKILPAAAVHDELLKRKHDISFASAEFRRAAVARGSHRAFAWGLFWTTLCVLLTRSCFRRLREET